MFQGISGQGAALENPVQGWSVPWAREGSPVCSTAHTRSCGPL